eukprot:77351_1
MKTAHIGYNNTYEVIFAYVYTWAITFVQAKYLYEASILIRNNLRTIPKHALPYKNAKHLLPKRWFGMNIDRTDWQYHTFDYHFKTQVAFSIGYVVLMHGFKKFIKWTFKQRLTNSHKSQNLTKIVKNITDLYLIVNWAFCFYMHGTSTIFMFFIMMITYFISKATYKSYYSNVICWAWNLFIGIIISRYDHSYFAFSVFFHPSLKWLDQWRLVQMRWNQPYRLTMLRCISFHMDLRAKYLNAKLYKCPHDDKQNKDYLHLDDFSLINFFAYTLYTPLLISGPIISFYDWMNQLKCNLSYDAATESPYYHKELSYRYLAVYVLRFIFCYFFLQIWLHFIWTNAFIHYGFPMKIEDLQTMEDYKTYMIVLCSFGFLHLAFIWMKFLVIWRYARMWSLFDGIVPTENMQSCYAATTQIASFWKYWHSSFYLWNKRYVYIPMGGSKYSVVFGSNSTLKYTNILVVFAFTALWHGDYSAALIVWGSLMGLGILPEIFANHWYWSTNVSAIVRIRNNEYLNRYVHAVFGGLIDVVLITANMIGYGPGFYGIVDIWKTLLSSMTGWYVLMWGLSWTFIGNIMIIHMKYMQSKKTFAAISITDTYPIEAKKPNLQQ